MFEKISAPLKNNDAFEHLKSSLQENTDKKEVLSSIPAGWLNALCHSPYLSRLALREIDFLIHLNHYGFDSCFRKIIKETFKDCADISDKEILASSLRQLKRKTALLIALADLTQSWSLKQVTGALSLFAEAVTRRCVCFLMRDAMTKGEINAKNKSFPDLDCGFFVLAMGKLGGYELNYSSDIDLIVLYDTEKMPYTGKKDPASFAVKITRNLIALLQENTVDGYVFRTDLRLRPDPGSTPIAISTQAATFYYESFAQNWERAAFIKARAIAGDKTIAKSFLKEIRPFVWRRSSDFYVLNQINDMKPRSGDLLTHQSPLFGHNIKLEQGGIRQIEFFTQLQQLLWGGRDTALRSGQTQTALCDLCRSGWIKEDVRDNLNNAYVFLRSVEHRLQMLTDEQTQTLPKNMQEMTLFSRFCGFPSEKEFLKALRFVLIYVQKQYDSLFHTENASDTSNFVFSGTDLPAETEKNLKELGFKNTEMIADSVRGWLSGRYRSMRSEKARCMIVSLFPPLFKALAKSENPDKAFTCFDDFLKALPSGVQLFSLFQSRPVLIDLLAEISGKSPFLSHILSVHPELFDTVLSPSFLNVPTKENLTTELNALLNNEEDIEGVLDSVRRFVREQKFQISLRFLRGLNNIDDTGKHLADLTDTAICSLLPFILNDFEKRYGKPENGKIAVVLCGKAGSREMNILSDLDILFIYDGTGQSVGGKSSLPAMVYYARLAQKIINVLSANTREGILFNIDMRLRPSGSSGPVATSFSSFEQYYEKDAWTWEFQALTKARIIFSDDDLKEKINSFIQKQLSKKRDLDSLSKDITYMRHKIGKNNPLSPDWNIKEINEGLIDLEFMVQYIQLAFAHRFPDLLRRSVNDVLMKACENNLISKDVMTKYADRYRLLRTITTLQALCADSFKEKTTELFGYQNITDFENNVLKSEEIIIPPYENILSA